MTVGEIGEVEAGEQWLFSAFHPYCGTVLIRMIDILKMLTMLASHAAGTLSMGARKPSF